MAYQSLALAFFTGFVVGVVFRILKLPVPAPSTLEGILGIVGIFVGYLVVKTLGA
ncbi:TPA: XapX domain-containing protein [Candidatus Micrarchaeota archaeon]|nr:XapX domain-containing protein [Candidatus Micrarchaeota archaeon]